MEAINERFSIVIVGRWNPHIFTPTWVKQNLCMSGESEVALAIPVDDPDAPNQLAFEGIRLYPSRTKLDIRPDQPTIEGMLKSAGVATKVLDLLGHTPISAVGVNFGFAEPKAHEKLTKVFSHSDAGDIDSEKFKLQTTEIARAFRLADDRQMNLRLQYFVGQPIAVYFNFHQPASTAEDTKLAVVEAQVRANFDLSLEFLDTAYGLALEGEGNAKD